MCAVCRCLSHTTKRCCNRCSSHTALLLLYKHQNTTIRCKQQTTSCCTPRSQRCSLQHSVDAAHHEAMHCHYIPPTLCREFRCTSHANGVNCSFSRSNPSLLMSPVQTGLPAATFTSTEQHGGMQLPCARCRLRSSGCTHQPYISITNLVKLLVLQRLQARGARRCAGAGRCSQAPAAARCFFQLLSHRHCATSK
jgi:hypothetical protein